MQKNQRIFVCFAAKDRYNIVEPIVYHLKNYGIDLWYDRYEMVLGDNRIEKNLIEGARSNSYALIILSKNTICSKCAMEEIGIIKDEYYQGKIIVFPILYEILPDELPARLHWIKEVIFKETNHSSGTREICNHIACKITQDILDQFENANIESLLSMKCLPIATVAILDTYLKMDSANLNSRISLLYAAYLTIAYSKKYRTNRYSSMITKIYERLINELNLNLNIDYRELWLLENTMCILCNIYLLS